MAIMIIIICHLEAINYFIIAHSSGKLIPKLKYNETSLRNQSKILSKVLLTVLPTVLPT